MRYRAHERAMKAHALPPDASLREGRMSVCVRERIAPIGWRWMVADRWDGGRCMQMAHLEACARAPCLPRYQIHALLELEHPGVGADGAATGAAGFGVNLRHSTVVDADGRGRCA
jgi:hypothetical protein